jgi:hypothetical protein
MAQIEPHPVQPKRVDRAQWLDVGFDYDDVSDTFTLYLFGLQHPSKVLHTPAFFDLLVDPATETIVGYQIEGFLTHVIYDQPWLLTYAEVAGIPQERVAAARDRIMRDHRDRLAETFVSIAERAVLHSA